MATFADILIKFGDRINNLPQDKLKTLVEGIEDTIQKSLEVGPNKLEDILVVFHLDGYCKDCQELGGIDLDEIPEEE